MSVVRLQNPVNFILYYFLVSNYSQCFLNTFSLLAEIILSEVLIIPIIRHRCGLWLLRRPGVDSILDMVSAAAPQLYPYPQKRVFLGRLLLYPNQQRMTAIKNTNNYRWSKRKRFIFGGPEQNQNP